jgi:ATP-binding cassette subfamily F protein uup
LLQDVLSEYDGTLLLVSHDRDFLDRLVTSTIAVEGDGDVQEYVGGYSDYVIQRGDRVAPKRGANHAFNKLAAAARAGDPSSTRRTAGSTHRRTSRPGESCEHRAARRGRDRRQPRSRRRDREGLPRRR